ncbi:MAG: ParB/RepB/Spo0J family partition protein [Phycisphaeraceae bacterium]|nr:ParB/RepB/Spo0J family partition protein [Phycisphaeraceae bacterium]
MPDPPTRPTPQTPAQRTQALPIDRLDAHPLNSNAMPKALFDKLVGEIQRTGLYPPIIARPIGERYQVLDGHHRVMALKRLGHTTAHTNLWAVDDEQAMLLLASLNRMRGEDAPRKRAALLDRLGKTMPVHELARRLPEDGPRVKKYLALNAATPSPQAPRPVDQMPVCLTFFVLPAQRRAIEKRLRDLGGTRESALLALLNIPQGDNR